jgi:anti-sigma regulatory factor (Ser/Thr protein kinase)
METVRNRVVFDKSFSGRNLKDATATIYRLVEKQAYQDIILDYRSIISVYESGMVPFIAYLSKLRREKDLGVTLFLPTERRVAGIFLKSQWAHYLSPDHFDPEKSRSNIHTEIQSYSNATEQYGVVDSILSVIMNSMNVSKGNIDAIEWALNEITDNVLNHAGDAVTGYVQALKYSNNNVVEFVVADCGIGIPASLGIDDHAHALERAIEAGVTRNKETNQGNGLYGSFNIAREAKGQFDLKSYNGSLYLADRRVRYKNDAVPFPGTSVRWSINLTETDLIRRALKFNDRVHVPSNTYFDRLYGDDEIANIEMKKAFSSFRSREAGKAARIFISNIVLGGKIVALDFTDINIISSSFADEVFGRLFKEFGPVMFSRVITMKNVNKDVSGLIDRAVLERLKS